MKYVSLFAGIGGFDLALNRLGHEAVYVNEWDKYSAQTYEKNFRTNLCRERGKATKGNGTSSTFEQSSQPTTEGLQQSGDKPDHICSGNSGEVQCVDTRSITDVPTSEIPDHDILVGGFPCQAFSIAGKRRGFDDTRGTMFFEVARILRDKRPRYFILENVKGLLSHDEGKTFQTILGVLTDLGYEYQWQVLNSKNFGVPQNRERVFIVGHIRGESRPQVFPIQRADGMAIEKDDSQTANTLTANYWKGSAASRPIIQVNQPRHSNDRVYADKGISPTLNTMGGGRRQPKVMRTPLKFLDRNQKSVEGDYSFTVDSLNTGGVKIDSRIRRLTPLECERLQGFPDNWTEGVSDTQRYKQLGNAVTVNVVYEVAKHL